MSKVVEKPEPVLQSKVSSACSVSPLAEGLRAQSPKCLEKQAGRLLLRLVVPQTPQGLLASLQRGSGSHSHDHCSQLLCPPAWTSVLTISAINPHPDSRAA